MELEIKDVGDRYDFTLKMGLVEMGSDVTPDVVRNFEGKGSLAKSLCPNEHMMRVNARGAVGGMVAIMFHNWRAELITSITEAVAVAIMPPQTAGGEVPPGASGDGGAISVAEGVVGTPPVGPCPHGVPADGYCSSCTLGGD